MTSKATKRKIVTKEAIDDYFIPEDDEEIVKIVAPRGNNLHEVESASGTVFLASMPTKFRKNIWVKRGDFVVTVPIKEGNKVQAEIIYILLAKQIKYLKDEKLWPEAFDEKLDKKEAVIEPIKMNGHSKEEASCSNSDTDSSENDDTDDELFQNPNHRPMYYYEDTEDESSEDDDDDDDEEDDADDESEGDGERDNDCNPDVEAPLKVGTPNKAGMDGELSDAIARVKLK